jgi:hypothetical protein
VVLIAATQPSLWPFTSRASGGVCVPTGKLSEVVSPTMWTVVVDPPTKMLDVVARARALASSKPLPARYSA